MGGFYIFRYIFSKKSLVMPPAVFRTEIGIKVCMETALQYAQTGQRKGRQEVKQTSWRPFLSNSVEYAGAPS